jgi:enterobacteria phage integrase
MARLPYIKEYTDDCGVRRRYFRRKGFKGGPLPGPIGSPEFMEAYQAHIGGKPALLARDANGPGTFGGLIADYYRSVEYANLKPNSKTLYRYALEPLKEKHGHRPLGTMTRENLVRIIETIGSRAPGMANLTRAVLQKMLKVAVARGQIRINPLADKVEAYKIGAHHSWSDSELERFEVRWPLGTRQRLAYALLFYTGQRSGDVVRMTRGDIFEGRIKVVQEKTGTELKIKIHPDLAKAIKAGPAKGLNLIGDAHGRPIKRAALSHLMRDAIRKAGLPARCVPHGLRKAMLRVMAEGGASAKRLAAVSGHKTTKELDRYTAAADQQTLADDGIASIPSRTRK